MKAVWLEHAAERRADGQQAHRLFTRHTFCAHRLFMPSVHTISSPHPFTPQAHAEAEEQAERLRESESARRRERGGRRQSSGTHGQLAEVEDERGIYSVMS